MARDPSHRPITVGLNAVVVAVTDEEPRVLVVHRSADGSDDALPFGPFDPEQDRTLELALRAWVREQTGLGVGYVEQLYTFGDRNRDPSERQGGPRVLSIGYLTLVCEGAVGAGTGWRGWYAYLPWEDWRQGRPGLIERVIEPALDAWADHHGSRPEQQPSRRERIDIAFGLAGATWDSERVLDRYELLYEAGLVAEAERDREARLRQRGAVASRVGPVAALGRPMAFDHRRILATAVCRIRGKIRYRPVVFELTPPTFTLFQLQRVVEALAGVRLHKQNFRRLVERGGLVEGTGKQTTQTGGRPAELFRFRREVLRERPALGVGLPGVPGASTPRSAARGGSASS